MTARLQLHLLGPPQIVFENRPLTALSSAKAQALLFYLAATGRVHARAGLAPLLWGDVDDAAARASLRKALQQLRGHLAPLLTISREHVGFSANAGCWVDVIEFDAALRSGGDDIHRLQEAVDLYRGDFLHGFYIRNAPDFEAWWLAEQVRLREHALRALERLAEYHATEDDLDKAIACTRRSLALEPWREESHRRLMLLLAENGQRSAALAQFEICRKTLADELAVEPDPEIVALYERIRGGEVVSARVAQRAPDAAARRPRFLYQQPPRSDPAEERLVGREPQLARLDNILTTARSGRGQVAFISGEAGRGKTSLLAAFSHRAQERDPALIVASGLCTTSTGAGDPYLPFREILRMLTGDIEQGWMAGTISHQHALRLWRFFPQVLEAIAARGRTLIGSFLPAGALLQRAAAHQEVRQATLRQIEAAARQAGREDRTAGQERVFEGFSDVLQALASRQPLLLILDDLHWADASSTNLLFHLGRRLQQAPLMIVGAYRPEEMALAREHANRHLPELLNEFRRTFGDAWVNLDQGTPEEERAFVDAVVDLESNRLGASFRQALYRHTDGHPLFTVETLRAMRERGDLSLDATGCWVAGESLDWNTVPARVEAVIENRVQRLDPALARLLAIASVEGEIFTAEVAARIGGVDERDMVARLTREANQQHRLVREEGVSHIDDRRLSLFRFRHNLFQRFLYSQLGEAERIYLHQDVGNALETLFGEQTGQIAVDLAFHFQQAAMWQKAIHYLHQAGVRAMALSANEEAIGHFNRGLALLDSLNGSADRGRLELNLRIALGEAQRYAGRVSAALETFQDAAAVARQLGSAEDLASAALGFEETRWRYQLPAGPSAALLHEALNALGDEESVLRVRVLGGLARALMAGGVWSEPAAMVQEAIRAARRLNDPMALLDMLRIYLYASRDPAGINDRIAAADEMVQLAQRVGSQERLTEAVGSRIHELLVQGDVSRLDREQALHIYLGQELRQPFFLHMDAVFATARMLLAGDFAAAEQQALLACSTASDFKLRTLPACTG
ncbi:MAG: AAA family ATPase [Caldilineales bacterium]